MFFEDLADKIDGQSSCIGKIKYSEKSANEAAVKMQQKKQEPFEAYKCRHCDGWHIGHPRFWGWTEKEIEDL